jgi:alkanesulfonate monooxygenase SsuD/methylene tetrahydromethanopterin reductase-like flavin-dependent oxidoreductase (luciferase family)
MGADGPRMMRLAARHADLWTCTYLGDPQKVVEPRERLAAACLAEGRDPASIEVAVGEWIVYGDASAAPAGIQAHTLGSPGTVAELLDGYDRVGVHHVLLQSGTENYDAVLERFGEAADAYRRATTPG